MLWYIIDGWNIIHKIPSVKKSNFPKRDFIYFIKKNKITGSKNNRVTIVFDGKVDLEIKRAEGEFKIIFSGQRSADEIIMAEAEGYHNRKEVVIVSDDRQLIDFSRARGLAYLGVQDFLNKGKKKKTEKKSKDISYTIKRQITEEMRKIWLDKDTD